MIKSQKTILILGADGFIGKNLEMLFTGNKISRYTRNTNQIKVGASYDLVINCIGCNRSDLQSNFYSDNVEIFDTIWTQLEHCDVKKLVNISTKHATSDTIYGKTKLEGEKRAAELAKNLQANFLNLRLPGIFGPGCKPNYNSVVATWCVDALDGNAVQISDPSRSLELCHISEVFRTINAFLEDTDYQFNTFHTSLGDLSARIFGYKKFVNSVDIFVPTDELDRLLFSTFISYKSPSDTLMNLTKHGDHRGSFTELFKLQNAGQVSVSITPPNSGLRGGHFHSAKLEKFFVAQGRAKVRNTNVLTGEENTFYLDAQDHQTFITIPNWSHTIENCSDQNLILIIWASEVFDRENPDTINVADKT